MKLPGDSGALLLLSRNQPAIHACDLLLPLLARGHIRDNPNVTDEGLILIEPGYANVKNPSIFSVMASQPILHSEFLPAIKRLHVRIHAFRQISGMNSLRPAVSTFEVNGSSSEVQPRLVKVGAKFISLRYPDQHGRGIRHQPEPLFTLAKGLVGLLLFLRESG